MNGSDRIGLSLENFIGKYGVKMVVLMALGRLVFKCMQMHKDRERSPVHVYPGHGAARPILKS